MGTAVVGWVEFVADEFPDGGLGVVGLVDEVAESGELGRGGVFHFAEEGDLLGLSKLGERLVVSAEAVSFEDGEGFGKLGGEAGGGREDAFDVAEAACIRGFGHGSGGGDDEVHGGAKGEALVVLEGRGGGGGGLDGGDEGGGGEGGREKGASCGIHSVWGKAITSGGVRGGRRMGEAMVEPVITSDPEVMGGTPCFRGTRVPFKNLIDFLEGGKTLDDFLRQFPTVTREMAIEALEEAKNSLLARIA